MNSTVSNPDQPPDKKAVLFCYECGHESSVDGDWDLERRDGREAYTCPDCGTTITVRPAVESARVAGSTGGQSFCAGD